MNDDLTPIEELKESVKPKSEPKDGQGGDLVLTEKINNSVAEFYDKSLSNKTDKIQKLTEQLVSAEIDVKEKQIEGRKQVLKSNIESDITRAKATEDAEKHERAKTVLKAQGLTEKLPSAFRVTALVIGYPFFVIYLLSLGWVIEFFTFVVKGFITMIYDCADKFATLNAKFIENGNNKQFSLGKALFNIMKWLLVAAVGVVAMVLLLKR